MAEHDNRCRLVLVAPPMDDGDALAAMIADALRGGDVATVILPQYGVADEAFQVLAEKVVSVAQAADVALVVHGDSRVAGRVKADGVHITEGVAAATDAIERHAPKMMVGVGNVKDRHWALEIGELRPDYIFFGKLDGDIKPEAHPKNLALAEWWSSMIEIPCIVMGGTSTASALEIAENGAEFAAMRLAVFDNPLGAAQAVAEINALLAEKAPRFET